MQGCYRALRVQSWRDAGGKQVLVLGPEVATGRRAFATDSPPQAW